MTPTTGDGGWGPFLHRSTTVALFTGLGVLAGFLVDLLIVARFGVGSATDAFFAAYTLPFILVTTLAALQPVLVTLLAAPSLVEGKGQDGGPAFSALLNGSGLVAVAVTVVGMVAARPLIAVTVPGFDRPTAELAARLARILFLRVLLAAVSEVCRAELYARQRFALATFGGVLPSLVAAFLLFLVGGTVGMEVVAWSLVVGALLQALLLLGALVVRLQIPYHPRLSRSGPVLRRAGALVLAPLAGLLLRQAVVLAERLIGSYLPPGNLTALSYANRLTMIAAGVLFDGLTTAALPVLARLWGEGQADAARAELGRLLRLVATVALPMGLAVAVLSLPLIRLFFERGQVDRQSARLMGTVLGVYALSLPFVGPYRVVQSFFYAVQRARPVVLLHGGLAVLTVALDLVLVRPLGATGLALGFVLSSALVTVVGLAWMGRRAEQAPWRELGDLGWRLGLASVGMVAAVWGAGRGIGLIAGDLGRWGLLLTVGLSSLIGLALFVGLGAVVRLEVIAVLSNALRAGLKKVRKEKRRK